MECSRYRKGMTRPATFVATGLLLLGACGEAAAQATTTRDRVERKWNALRDRATEQLKAGARIQAIQSREEATRQSSLIAAIDAVEPDESSGAATVRRLAGALKTSPEGTEAGIVIAPFVLAGSTELQGLEITFASLKGDLTRAAASYTWDKSTKLEEVWKAPEMCPVTPAREKALEKPRDYYLTACSQVIAALPEDVPASVVLDERDRTAYRARVHEARIACGLMDSAPGEAMVSTMPEALALVRGALDITNRVAARTEGVVPAAAGSTALILREDTEAVTNWSISSATSCYSKDAIRAHFQQLYWDRRKWKFSVTANWDLFPRKYGFSPDDSALPRGHVKVREGRADFSTSRTGIEMSGGVAVGQTREEFSDELRSYVAPTISFARAVSLLPGRMPLTTAGVLNFEDGDLPPRLVLGLVLEAELARDRPASQDTRYNSVKVQPHLDFLINDKLSFRLGIPIKGEIAVRKAKDEVPATATTPAVPAVLEKRALQWTVPVAIVAAIKM